MRPDHFHRHVVVNLPDKTGREAIHEVYIRNVPIGSDVSLEDIAAATPGFSGADLKNLVNEAALMAAQRTKTRFIIDLIRGISYNSILH